MDEHEKLKSRLRLDAAERRAALSRQRYPVGEYAPQARPAGWSGAADGSRPRRWRGPAAAGVGLAAAAVAVVIGWGGAGGNRSVPREARVVVGEVEPAQGKDPAAAWAELVAVARGVTPGLPRDDAWVTLAGATDWPQGLARVTDATRSATARLERPLRDEFTNLRLDVNDAVAYLRDRWGATS